MKLQAVAGEEEVDEALRLFQVSTLDAALSGSLTGMFHSGTLGEVLSPLDIKTSRFLFFTQIVFMVFFFKVQLISTVSCC